MNSVEKNKIIDICRKNDVCKVGLFGSVAMGNDTKASDIDLLIKFSNPKSLLFLVKLERNLSEALGRKVDLLTEASISPYLKKQILKQLTVIYETR